MKQTGKEGIRKGIRKGLAVLFAVAMSVSAGACGVNAKDYFGEAPVGGGEGYGEAADDALDGIGGTGETGAPGEGEGEGTEKPVRPAAGQMTAGAWDDNAEYSFFLSLFEKAADEPGQSGMDEDSMAEETDGIFQGYKSEDKDVAWGMYPLGRVEARVQTADGTPAAGVAVELTGSGNGGGRETLRAVTGADGKAYLFPAPSVTEYTLSAEYGGAEIPMTEEDGVFTAVVAQAQAYTGLDLCFMVDTTGSMADELLYLQSELDDVIGRVQAEFPEADISLGLLFYRDEGDEYVVRSSDFTPDIAAQRKFLLAQEAAGGGDYPEAVREALETALDLSWREGTRKILIPVLDAPPHDQNAQRQDIRAEFGKLVYRAAGEGIAVMPVAASGVDVCSQYLLRSSALLTGGKYVFLTDDSGIGGTHQKPAVGEYTVEYLNSCLVRLIGELYDGVARPAVDWRQET